MMLARIKAGIDLRLSKMDRFSGTGPGTASRFDLFNQKRVGGDKKAIDAAFEFKNEVRLIDLAADGHFGLIPRGPFLLETLVPTSSFERAVAAAEPAARAEIAGTADELDQ